MSESSNLVTPVMRVWFKPFLIEPRAPKPPSTSKPKYAMTCAFEPTALDSHDRELWVKIVAAANDSAMAKHKTSIKDFPDGWKKPWHSGKDKKNYGMTDQMLYASFSSEYQPNIAGPDAKRIEHPLPDYIYAGCYVRLSTNPYSYKNNGGAGTNLGVFNVFFVKPGDRLNFGASPEEDFKQYATSGQTATNGRTLTDEDLGF